MGDTVCDEPSAGVDRGVLALSTRHTQKKDLKMMTQDCIKIQSKTSSNQRAVIPLKKIILRL